MNADKDSIRAAVAKMMTDARVVAALSDKSPPPIDVEHLAHSHEKLWRAYEAACDHIELLEIHLAHYADLKWRN